MFVVVFFFCVIWFDGSFCREGVEFVSDRSICFLFVSFSRFGLSTKLFRKEGIMGYYQFILYLRKNYVIFSFHAHLFNLTENLNF